MIRPVALSEAHMECRSLGETLPVLTDLLAFEVVRAEPDSVTLRHHQSGWNLVAHPAGSEAPEKPMTNHFGVRVEKATEVDAAWEYVNAHRDEYGIYQMEPQRFRHGSYSIHFKEPGSNGWEIECYEYVLQKESGGLRLGGVRSRHWATPLSEERFPGRGYVPQAFTHGTIHCTSAPQYGAFVSEVLGLDAIAATAHNTYIKHPATKHYIVCLEVTPLNSFSPNFRFTITVESVEAVAEAHSWLAKSRAKWGLTDLRDVQWAGDRCSFLLCDPEGSWWEIASPT